MKTISRNTAKIQKNTGEAKIQEIRIFPLNARHISPFKIQENTGKYRNEEIQENVLMKYRKNTGMIWEKQEYRK